MVPPLLGEGGLLPLLHETVGCYCLNYNNEQKRASMSARFQQLGLPLFLYDGVGHDDPRLDKVRDDPALRRLWSVTYGHLDMLEQFLATDRAFGVFCEDDIVVNRELAYHLPHVMNDMGTHGIDFLLLGYMTTAPIRPSFMHTHLGNTDVPYCTRPEWSYFSYPAYQWGVHMYMVTRAGAQELVRTFQAPRSAPATTFAQATSFAQATTFAQATSFAETTLSTPDTSFSPDWTLSKCPTVRSALMYPMLAVEDGRDPWEHYAHDGQHQFHMETYLANFVSGLFI